MSCTTGCRRPSPSQAHCAGCHVTFGGVSGFDAHRRGGGCLPPGGLGYVVRDDVWRMPVTLERLAQLAALRVTPRAADGPAGIVGTSEPSKINNGDLALTLWGES